MNSGQSNSTLFPFAIIIAGLIIAGTVIMVRGNYFADPVEIKTDDSDVTDVEIRPVDRNEHILGNPGADILIVEYSDFACSFCQTFHNTMNRIISEYGKNGKVAWVYRHFPIDRGSKDNFNAAVSSECVADLNGNESFWQYTNILFDNSPDSLSQENLRNIAIDIGVDEEKYDACVADLSIEERINKDIEDGIKIYEYDANFGTPYSFVITKSGTYTIINGSQPYTVIKEILAPFI